MSDTTSAQYQDVRQLVLGGNVRAKRQPVYIEELGGWFTIQQLYANEKSALLQAATNLKTKSVDFTVLHTGLAVLSLRYPHPESAPTEPVEPVAPAGFDPAGNARPVPPDEEEKYQDARQQYLKDVAAFQHPYPMDHPRAGQLVFDPKDRDLVASHLPSSVQDAIVEPAQVLSGLQKKDIEEKKDFFGKTTVDSTSTSLPTSSDDQTLTDSSVNSQ